jgi:hypothetical protein
MVYQHPSLTCIDLGNFDTIKNRNRIHNEGLAAIIEGIVQTAENQGFCLISELQLQQTCLTNEGLNNFLKFTKVKDFLDL